MDIPKALYKYRTFDKDNHSLSILNSNKIFFSSPKKFNDPFDCAIKVNFDLGSKAQVIQKLIKLIKLENGDLKNSKIREMAKKKYKEKDIFFMKKPSEEVDAFLREQTNKSTGIFSLSEDAENLLMWSHYADSHKGFCIEFDGPKLGNYLTNFSFCNKLLIKLFKVNYTDKYPLLNPYLDSDVDRLQKSLLTKSNVWNYEKEWRAIYYNGSDREMEILGKLISKVILGINCTIRDKEKIITALKKRINKIPLYLAVMKKSEFGIEFIEVPY